ncbi:hypothetical protein ACAG26_14420 [Mycobacterium sp. pUA109]|uniref:hypothetical protein n=1 Tax=Mycobacterium sp. pUA109 TaxID=3238982 RepID=UPI00351B38AC
MAAWLNAEIDIGLRRLDRLSVSATDSDVEEREVSTVTVQDEQSALGALNLDNLPTSYMCGQTIDVAGGQWLG